MDLSSGRRRYLVWFFRTNILPTLGKVVGIATRWFSPKKGVDPAASIDGGGPCSSLAAGQRREGRP